MLTTETRRFQCQHVAELAREVLGELFELHTGERPRVLRVYRECDAAMLLLRFDPQLAGCGADAELEARMDASLMAMWEMTTEVVAQRTGADIAAGNFSVCVAAGLAVFGMRVGAEEQRSPTYLVRDGRGLGSREGDGARWANRGI